MKSGRAMAIFQCLGLALLLSLSDATGISGVERVLGMLEKMTKKAKTNRNDEELDWAKQKSWCQGRKDELETEISDAKDSIESLEAETERLEDDMSSLNVALAKLSSKLEFSKADLDKANKERAENKAAFEKEEKDYRESVDALGRAVKVLTEHQKAGNSLTQIGAHELGLPQQTSEMVTAFLSSDSDSDDPHSTGILDLLRNLLAKFKKELLESMKEEQQAKSSHEIVKAQTEATIEVDEEEQKSKTQQRDRHAVKVAENKKRLQQAETLIEQNKKALEETKRDCSIKEEEFHQKYKVLGEEMEALQKATDIIRSNLKSSLLQRPTAIQTVLAVLRGHASHRQEVRKFLEDEGRKQNSKTLALLVQKLDADPFAKVRGVINEILMKLQDKAMEEAKLNAYCDAETEKSKLSRTSLSEKVESLGAQIEELKAAIKELDAETKALSEDLRKSANEFMEAQEIRQVEEQKNKVTLKESQAAQKATAEAIQVLRDFYGNAALVQLGSQSQEESSSSTGLGVDSNSVIAMLEIIQADFAEVEEDTKVDEMSQKRAFEELQAETEETKLVMGMQVKHNTKDQKEKAQALNEAMDDLTRNEVELESSNRYYQKLNEKCGLTQESFDERVAKAKEEIESMKLALKMLSTDK